MPRCEGGIRITIGTQAENKLLLKAMNDWEIIKSLS
jgi:histidinol-phosphate/aromatic aminotransferase/cobyric acid decarboxylase-like protein